MSDKVGLSLKAQESLWAWVFLLPCVLGLGIFTYLPTLASFGLSFCYWNLLGTPQWVGLTNYQQVLGDPLFWKTFWNTWIFVFASAAGEIIVGLLLALALNQAIRGRGFLRILYFLPFITPMVSVSLVWGWIYEPQYGLLNGFLNGLGFHHHIAWLYNPNTAMGSLVVLRVWKNVGYNLVLFLAGLQAIPNSVYESAYLDGASAFQVLKRITLPMLSPTLFFVSLITLLNAFQVFDAIYLLTQGGPAHSTDVLVYWMFKNAFEFYKVGPASAIAYVLFAVMLVISLIQWYFRKRWVLHED